MENKLSPLQQALLDSVLAEYAHIPQEKEIEYTFSEKFERWAKKLITETDRPGQKHQLSKTVKLLIIVAAIIALLAACAVAIPALREGLIDFFLTGKVDHYGITFDPEQAATAPENVQTYHVPQSIPDGYFLVIDEKSVAGITMAWMNDNDELICYNQASIPDNATQDNWIGISSEGIDRITAIVSGYKVEIIQDEMVYTAIWTDNEYIYLLELPNALDLTVFEQILNSITVVS